MKDFIHWVLETDKETKVREDDSPAPASYYIGHGNTISVSKSMGQSSVPATFNFTVTNATGGKVVTVRHYDPHTDRSHETVYIITDKEDLGEELGQIITKESLSR